jgi:type VI secretion system secreted protein VgrG
MRMDQKLSQNNRLGVLTTPLGKDVLVLVRMDGTEGLSELFELRIEALSEKADLDFDDAIGRQCTVKLKTYGREREFSGIMVEAQWVGVTDDLYVYRVVLRPWLWLLSRTSDCRIFNNKKPKEIIEEVFQDRGFGDYEFKLTQSYPELEYCVQYRETDLDFVSRLMEQQGIYYFFKHTGGKHTLVLADSKSSHEKIPGQETIPFIPLLGDDRRDREHIHAWTSERRFRTGKFELNDYNYQKPNAKLLSDAKASERYARSDMELYDYPGKYKEQSDGERYAKIRLEADQALDHRRQGSGDAPSLFPGGITKLERHPSDKQNKEYLVVRASHRFADEYYRTSGRGSGQVYAGSYEFIPSEQPFRAPIVTPKPLIHGIQTAKVVTKDDGSNEEIDVEELGEVYVHFFWDRKKKRSCRLRVAQLWSGKKWGGQFIPRVGMEVVVEFLEGDPDRPLIVGTVYNDEYKLPYDLPAKKTIAGIKSDSTKGGGGYNELHFDDKKGSEKIRLHAEKDIESVIEDSESRSVGSDQSISVGRNRQLKVQNNENITILNNRSALVQSNYSVTVGQAMSITTTSAFSVVCGASTITMTPGSITIMSPSIQLVGPTAVVGGLVADGIPLG